MIDEDDNVLRDYDLDAWQPPQANIGGLADRVVAQLHKPVSAAAVDSDGDTDEPRRGRRWWIVGGAVAAAAAAALALALWGLTRETEPRSGVVATTQPTHLDLGASTAELEASTAVTWRRDGNRLFATQTRGSAMWKVDANDTIVIDAGATVASVEATGASLRVEVEMNLSDARIIGVTAATAAAVAIISVVVYEGHVKVTNNGQTVTVPPGTSIQIPPKPDRDLTVGATPDSTKDAALEAGRAQLQAVADACHDEKFHGEITAVVAVAPSGTVALTSTKGEQSDPADGEVLDCLARAIPRVTLAPTQTGATFTLRVAHTCDAAVLLKYGDEAVANGDQAAALPFFEAALTCKPTEALVVRAYMAACNSGNATKAHQYFPLIAAARQATLSQICIRNGIVLDVPAPPTAVPPMMLERLRVSGEKQIMPDDATKLAIEKSGKDKVVGSFKLCTTADGAVDSVKILKSTGFADYDRDIDRGLHLWRYAPYRISGIAVPVCTAVTFIYSQESKASASGPTWPPPSPPQAAAAPAGKPTCDADALETAGNDEVSRGNYAAALATYEKAIACKTSKPLINKAYLAACNSHNEPKAKYYFRQIDPAKQSTLKQICLRNGITVP